jgi:FkbM family methyltransferase
MYGSVSRTSEPTSLAVVGHFLEAGSTFVDVGANIGLFSMAAARRLRTEGHIVAIEPNADLVPALRTNVERHSQRGAQLTIINAAIGRIPGRIDLTLTTNSLVTSTVRTPSMSGPTRQINVEAFTLDQLNLHDVSVIKIDVEGAEPDVLAGARQLLNANAQMVMMLELNPSCLSAVGHSVDALLDHAALTERKIYLIDDGNSERPIQPIDDKVRRAIAAVPPEDRWYRNIVAVPPTRLRAFQQFLQGNWGGSVDDGRRP